MKFAIDNRNFKIVHAFYIFCRTTFKVAHFEFECVKKRQKESFAAKWNWVLKFEMFFLFLIYLTTLGFGTHNKVGLSYMKYAHSQWQHRCTFKVIFLRFICSMRNVECCLKFIIRQFNVILKYAYLHVF